MYSFRVFSNRTAILLTSTLSAAFFLTILIAIHLVDFAAMGRNLRIIIFG
jgi:hypothetical protein